MTRLISQLKKLSSGINVMYVMEIFILHQKFIKIFVVVEYNH